MPRLEHMCRDPMYIVTHQLGIITALMSDQLTLFDMVRDLIIIDKSKETSQKEEPSFSVVKFGGRLVIMNEKNETIYSPPDFIKQKIVSRDSLQQLAETFKERNGRDIDAIQTFEASFIK